jgi:hypothetical protein
MSRKPEFTIAQQAALDKVLFPKQVKRKLADLTPDDMDEIEAAVWKLPRDTTRGYVTHQAILNKLNAERQARQARWLARERLRIKP